MFRTKAFLVEMTNKPTQQGEIKTTVALVNTDKDPLSLVRFKNVSGLILDSFQDVTGPGASYKGPGILVDILLRIEPIGGFNDSIRNLVKLESMTAAKQPATTGAAAK